jgi:hypothetical protein
MCQQQGPKPAPNSYQQQGPANRSRSMDVLNDSAWKNAPVMTDLIEFRPKVGAVENPIQKPFLISIYDDEGIYFGGFCYERTRDSIATELVGRDGFGTNDYIGLIFDTL